MFNTITLNDGSTLEDAQIISNAVYLTDGRKPIPATPDAPVIVNGNVTFAGENTIDADEGQDALLINGTATVLAGSSLTATGGDTGVASLTAGSGVVLNGGTVTGDGSLAAEGGSNEGSIVFGGTPGRAVVGTGIISTGHFTATGGNGGGYSSETINGADAGEKGVWVTVADGSYTISGGTSVNGNAGVGKDSFSWGKKVDPQEKPENGSTTNNESPQPENPDAGDNGSGENTTKEVINDNTSLPNTADAPTVPAAAALVGAAALAATSISLSRKHLR